MIAILFGMLFGNMFQMRDSFIKGLDFTQKYILKLGIICLGIQLKPFEFLEFGVIFRLIFNLLIVLGENFFYIDVACFVHVSLVVCGFRIQPHRVCRGAVMGCRIP